MSSKTVSLSAIITPALHQLLRLLDDKLDLSRSEQTKIASTLATAVTDSLVREGHTVIEDFDPRSVQ